MESVLSFRKLLAQLKKLFWVWLALAVLAGIAALLIANAMNENRGHVFQVVSYSYEGIESGNDPAGNRFHGAAAPQKTCCKTRRKRVQYLPELITRKR